MNFDSQINCRLYFVENMYDNTLQYWKMFLVNIIYNKQFDFFTFVIIRIKYIIIISLYKIAKNYNYLQITSFIMGFSVFYLNWNNFLEDASAE